MDLNFILTGNQFPYPYYLAMCSAIEKIRHDQVNLYVADGEPSSILFTLLKDRINVIPLLPNDFPAFKSFPEGQVLALKKDYYLWKLAYEKGGIFMDLDTFTLRDISWALDADQDMAFPTDAPSDMQCKHPYNNDVVIARAGTEMAYDF